MHIDKFMPILLRCATIDSRWAGYNSWEIRRQYAALTEFIDYKCKINNSGKCEGPYRGPRLCCGTCVDDVGFLRSVPKEWDVIREMAKMFHKDLGFWRKGIGCVLPRGLRSDTCLRFFCHKTERDELADFTKKMVPENRLLMLFTNPGRFRYMGGHGDTKKNGMYLRVKNGHGGTDTHSFLFLPPPEKLKTLLKRRSK